MNWILFIITKLKVRLPRYDIPRSDPAHIFTKDEINMILVKID